MNEQDSKENKCRICLEDNIVVDWNAFLHDYSDLTYKDCYYKYTQLEYYVEADNFSTGLCHICSDGLEYLDAFISKAIETHMILQEKLSFNIIIKEDEVDTKNEPSDFETILVEDTDVKPDMQNILMYEESTDELLNAAADTSCSISERCASPLTQKPRKRKSIKTATSTEFVDAEDQLKNESLLDKKKHSTKMEQPICCSVCSKVLSSKYVAIKHEETHIPNRQRKETCIKCGLKFYSKTSLNSHMLTHIENREKAHKCDFCDKAFYSKGCLNVHRRIHLGQMVSCSLCTKKYYRQTELDKHMTSHSAVRITSDIKIKKKIFVPCKDCGENVRSTNFKSHTAKHMNEPLFKCAICNKEFFSRGSCDKHLKKIHKKTCGGRKNCIIAYKKNRLSHLFMEQYKSEQVKDI